MKTGIFRRYKFLIFYLSGDFVFLAFLILKKQKRNKQKKAQIQIFKVSKIRNRKCFKLLYFFEKFLAKFVFFYCCRYKTHFTNLRIITEFKAVKLHLSHLYQIFFCSVDLCLERF